MCYTWYVKRVVLSEKNIGLLAFSVVVKVEKRHEFNKSLQSMVSRRVFIKDYSVLLSLASHARGQKKASIG